MPDDRPESGEEPPFSRIITPDQAGPALTGRIEASESERRLLAPFYRIHGLASLTFDYSLEPLPSGCWRLTGALAAALTQLCGVTLEPVDETIHEDVSVEYWPESRINRATFPGEDEDILAHDPPEPIVNGRIDLGHLAAEIFASAINPYPRKEGVAFDWTDPQAAAKDAASKPFAVLGKLVKPGK